MAEYTVIQERAECFYDEYERKAELKGQTHYCPGCGHGTAHKLIAKAIDELKLQDRVILVSPVGCSVFAYYYFDVGNVQAAHGRAPAVATAIKRSRPDSIVMSYQGDGDLAAIGSAEILHASNRGEPITVFFINNTIYGMTGGQMAPTTLIGQRSTTSPLGRNEFTEGYPLHVCELLATLQAPVYLERVALGNSKQVLGAARAIKKALEVQAKGLGFSLVEILSPCPTIWKLKPTDAQARVREELVKTFPLGVFRDRIKEAPKRPVPAPGAKLEELAGLLDIEKDKEEGTPWKGVPGGGAAGGMEEGTPWKGVPGVPDPAEWVDWEVKIAGFGGQGVLMLGEILAEAGLMEGLQVSWLPSYGPEMRSGTSNCHVRVSNKPIDSPMVTQPNVLLALNEPSLEKFHATVVPGGWVFYNGTALPPGLAARQDIHYILLPFAKLADELGEARVGNIVMLGALLQATNLLTGEAVDAALRKHVKTERWLSLDRKALEVGHGAVKEVLCHAVC